MKLNENFNQQEFIDWISNFLPDFSKDIRKVDVSKNFQGIKSIQTIGESALGVRVYIIETEQDPSKRKIGLATESFTLLRDYGTPNAIIVYYSENSSLWRLSLLTSTLTWDEGKIKKKLSNPKRQSYVLGSKARVKTPHQYLISKGGVTDFADLKSRFSLEVVNKEFYKEISSAFIQLVGGQIANGKSKKIVEAQLKLPYVPDQSRIAQEFAVRLIGRIIFCWFLREKKSPSGRSFMPIDLLSLVAVQSTKDYYHTILEPIFFEVLNKKVNTRNESYTMEPFSEIPYLNGGLFAPHYDDHYDKKKRFIVIVPDAWFVRLFDILESYNFTIDENTSFDEELSIDPEMLGRIFENLLAEINPETGESARKSTGSYYTPRVIVDYMVDESMYLYLKDKTGINEKKLRSVISYDLEDDSTDPLTDLEKDKITQSLQSIKILDPACGSGAFPMGALQKIVFILQQIDPHGQLWFNKQIHNTSVELRRLIQKEFEEKNFDYLRKLGIIRENIYGVDIQPIATEISRLRCFLTLVVDQRVDDTLPNRGIEPLPNLDFKFVTANTLLGMPQQKLISGAVQQDLFDSNQSSKIEELRHIKDSYFGCNDAIEKSELKSEFRRIQNDLWSSMHRMNAFGQQSLALSGWDPFSHEPTDWFDPDWMFGIKDGFDIVISNPPYLRVQKLPIKDKEVYNRAFISATGAYDLYVLFTEKSFDLLNTHGVLCHIMPDKWTNGSFGKGLRKITQNYVSKIISFKQHQVFNASTYSSLLWLRKDIQKQILYAELGEDLPNNSDLHLWLSQLNEKSFNPFDNKNLTNSGWDFSVSKNNPVIQCLLKHPQTLGDITRKIFQGIATSADKIYVMSIIEDKGDLIRCFSKKLNCEILVEKDLTRPFLMGKDVHRYQAIKAKNVVIFPYTVQQNKAVLMTQDEIQARFPLGWEYLVKNKCELENREHGKFADNWWCFSRPQNMTEFASTKIMTPEIALGCQLTIDESGNYYHTTKVYSFVFNEKANASIKYYLGLLNSKILWYFLTQTGYVLRGGYYTFKTDYLKPFPIPESSIAQQKNIEELVGEVLHITKQPEYESKNRPARQIELEGQIDRLVYELYGLTEEEIKIVEDSHRE